jgi:hypothetical protein
VYHIMPGEHQNVKPCRAIIVALVPGSAMTKMLVKNPVLGYTVAGLPGGVEPDNLT